MRITVERVHFMPSELKPGGIYVSEEFGIAVHLCACGCGSKIKTPLGATEWSLEETRNGPSLRPSIGNWQRPCQSHYWITQGEIEWAPKWTPEEILAGRHREEERRRAYYETLDNTWSRRIRRFWYRVKGLLGF
jgi:Family of unknown function (DUF6527)